MPQVLFAVTAAVGLYAGYRLLAKVAGQGRTKTATPQTSSSRADAARDLGTLEFDPVSKAYRPRGQ